MYDPREIYEGNFLINPLRLKVPSEILTTVTITGSLCHRVVKQKFDISEIFAAPIFVEAAPSSENH
jgi:hypothetical protein